MMEGLSHPYSIREMSQMTTVRLGLTNLARYSEPTS